LTLAAHGDSTEMTFHLRGCAGHPGDKYFYDGWSSALNDLTTHLLDQRQ